MLYDIQFFFTCTYGFFGVFFLDPDPDFTDRIRIFWLIRTQEKKSAPDPDIRTRIRNTARKVLLFSNSTPSFFGVSATTSISGNVWYPNHTCKVYSRRGCSIFCQWGRQWRSWPGPPSRWTAGRRRPRTESWQQEAKGIEMVVFIRNRIRTTGSNKNVHQNENH